MEINDSVLKCHDHRTLLSQTFSYTCRSRSHVIVGHYGASNILGAKVSFSEKEQAMGVININYFN